MSMVRDQGVMPTRPLHVAIDARAANGLSGGVGELTLGYAKALNLFDPDKFIFSLCVTSDINQEMLRELVPRGTRFVQVDTDQEKRIDVDLQLWANDAIKASYGMKDGWCSARLNALDSTDLFNSHQFDVFHGLLQFSLLHDVPMIYHPHDLQHLHFPEYFSKEESQARELMYQLFCRRASIISVASRWIKNDIEKQYNVNENKIYSVPWVSTAEKIYNSSSSAIKDVCDKYMISAGDFIIYPAQTWKHKNHLGLFQALALLQREGGPVPSLVLTGFVNEQGHDLLDAVVQLGLSDKVKFLGYVSRNELSLLYQLARCTVIPTKFEAGSLPIFDAFTLGCPVACSNVTSLPDQADGGALLFNPDDIAEMASVIRRLWTDVNLRCRLIRRGNEVVARLSWDAVVQNYGVLYRLARGEMLSESELAGFAARFVY
ncbi:MAG TPA: glycosyltransferase family 4 protein [Rhodospirillaceae bacterium]|nr:glycosyltransferase family 4 protein [Rhodospirillaceae bacterium]